MTIELEIHDYGVAGWQSTYNTNFQKLNTHLESVLNGASKLGEDSIADVGSLSGVDLVPGAGTPSQNLIEITTSGDDLNINNNFASIADESNKIIDDLGTLKDKINDVLEKLRKTTGNGVIGG